MTHQRIDLPLDPDKIMADLKTRRIGRKVLVYDSTSSTQTIAAEYTRNRENDGLVIFTEQQTGGRGRAGNKWQSGRSDSILCSVVLAENDLPAELLSLTCAVAVAEAVGKAARIKWPNDIMLNGKKVAGILLESRSLPISDCRMPISRPGIYVVGIGINCHQKVDSFAAELRSIATSIDIETNSVTDRISLARRLLTAIDHWLELAARDGDEVIGQWQNLSIQLGHRVELIYNGRRFAGNCIGIDPEKGLVLQLDTGGVRMFDAVHSSIAKRA
ncbi:MAG: biotin--[acetyl-CoA-carboxylase] ligase [Planctomycetota bacterium]|jgi:BirA family biotin operon repressor/biotin-[acetyl-CoA-carboxylase] ligase